MFIKYFQIALWFTVAVWNKVRTAPFLDKIIDEQLADTLDEQAARMKRRLQEYWRRQEGREKKKV